MPVPASCQNANCASGDAECTVLATREQQCFPCVDSPATRATAVLGAEEGLNYAVSPGTTNIVLAASPNKRDVHDRQLRRYRNPLISGGRV